MGTEGKSARAWSWSLVPRWIMSVCIPPLPRWPSWRAQNCCTSTRVIGSGLHCGVDDVGWWVAKLWHGIVSRISGAEFLAVVPPRFTKCEDWHHQWGLCFKVIYRVALVRNVWADSKKRSSADGLRLKGRIIVYNRRSRYLAFAVCFKSYINGNHWTMSKLL